MGWTGRNNDQWIEYADQEWTVQPDPFYLLKQIWTDDTYVYAATSDGLNIIELESELPYAHVTYYDGFNSVWADDNRVYLATPASGVKYIEKTCISGSIGSPYELITCLFDHLRVPDIASDRVRYIHGNNGYTAIVTISGVDTRGPDTYYEIAFGGTKLARKCFITSTGKVYYTTYNGSSWQINVVDSPPMRDWTTPDRVHSAMFAAGVDINDIFVDNDIIYVATSSGIYAINDITESVYSPEYKGTSDYFPAVWVANGRLIIGSIDTLSIVDINTNTVVDWYTTTFSGKAGEALTNTDIKDIVGD